MQAYGFIHALSFFSFSQSSKEPDRIHVKNANMKNLLTITAIIEIFTGIVLLIVPSVAVSLLLGSSLSEQSGILLGRMCGVALITLAVACWMAKGDNQSSVTMIKAMALYNMGAAMLLSYAGAIEHFSGIGLLPTVVLHIALLVWCFRSLQR